MFGHSARGNKLSTGFGASTSGVNTSEFHLIRQHEMDRSRAIKDLGADEESSHVPPSFFVPSLQAICADNLAQSFATAPEIDLLQGEHTELYDMIIERLPVAALPEEMDEREPIEGAGNNGSKGLEPLSHVDGGTAALSSSSRARLPLGVAVARVVSEGFWKRCCLARWSSGQLSKFAGGKPLREKQYGWKRLFLEHVLSDFLMSLRSPQGGVHAHGRVGEPRGRTHTLGIPEFLSPFSGGDGTSAGAGGPMDEDDDDGSGDFRPSQLSDEDARALASLCAVCRDYVHTVDLPCQYTHLNWYEHLFSRLPGILSFRLSHGTASAGIGFDKAMLGFTDADAESVRRLLSRYTSLEALRLPQNKLKGPHVMMISAGLVGNTRLRVLDLSRNAIDDSAVVDGLALLLCQPEFPLEELYLNDNNISTAGAKALADALVVNRTLTVLNVGQNRIGDAEGDGAAALVRALVDNPRSALRELNLSNNLLSARTVAALREVLPATYTLASLNLAGNRRIGSAGPTTTDALCEAVAQNSSLFFIDVRFCNLTTEQVCAIEGAVQSRVARASEEVRNAKEEEQRNRIAEVVSNRPTGRY